MRAPIVTEVATLGDAADSGDRAVVRSGGER